MGPVTPRTHLVLGGGGAMGAFQAGALRALLDTGLAVDALHGTSVGAVNAAFLAAAPGPDRAARLTELWSDPAMGRVLRPGWPARARGLVRSLRRGAGFLDDRPLRRLVADHVPAHDLGELAVPLSVTTTCLDCGAAARHRTGPVGDVLAASCALPGLFAPVRLPDGHLHVDGGIVDGVPVAGALADAGPDDRVLVLDCGLAPVTAVEGRCAAHPRAAGPLACGVPADPDRDPYVAPVEAGPGALDTVLQAFTVARTVANRAAVAGALADPRMQVLPHVADAWAAGLLDRLPTGPRDTGGARALLAAGREVTARWLSAGTELALR